VLEVGTVQSVGSTMIFKDAWFVIDYNNRTIILDKLANLEEGDRIYNGENLYKIESCNPLTYFI
jgi:hypothetical protein